MATSEDGVIVEVTFLKITNALTETLFANLYISLNKDVKIAASLDVTIVYNFVISCNLNSVDTSSICYVWHVYV